MPQDLQAFLLVAAGLIAAGALLWSIAIAVRRHTAVPVLLVVASFCSIVLEPICTYLGHAVHAGAGAITLFTAIDRVIPWHIALGYTAAFSLTWLTLYQKAMAGSLTRGFLWKTGFVVVGALYLFEIIGVSGGMWTYYEPQPLWIWRMTAPPTWSFLNATCELVAISLILFLLPHLRGWRQIAVVPLGPVGVVMGHMGAGWPLYNAVNSKAPSWLIELSGVATIALCLFLWWICSILATTPPAEQPAGIAGDRPVS